MPSLSALRAFAALSEAGSFTRAGEALNVSHAAISQQVRALEGHLGVSLILRDRRGTLTPDGERLAQALHGAFAAIGRAVEEVTGGDATRPLQVSTTSAFAISWLMPRLSEFRLQHPEVELMVNPTATLVEVGPGGIDVAIRFGRGPWRGLESTLLVRTSMVPSPRPPSSPAAGSPRRATCSRCRGSRSSAPARCRTGCATTASSPRAATA